MRPCEPHPRRVTMPHAHADEPRHKTPRTRDARARAAHRRIVHMGKDQLSLSPTASVDKTDHRRCPSPRAARQRTERHLPSDDLPFLRAPARSPWASGTEATWLPPPPVPQFRSCSPVPCSIWDGQLRRSGWQTDRGRSVRMNQPRADRQATGRSEQSEGGSACTPGISLSSPR